MTHLRRRRTGSAREQVSPWGWVCCQPFTNCILYRVDSAMVLSGGFFQPSNPIVAGALIADYGSMKWYGVRQGGVLATVSRCRDRIQCPFGVGAEGGPRRAQAITYRDFRGAEATSSAED